LWHWQCQLLLPFPCNRMPWRLESFAHNRSKQMWHSSLYLAKSAQGLPQHSQALSPCDITWACCLLQSEHVVCCLADLIAGCFPFIAADFIVQAIIIGLVAFQRNYRCSDAVCSRSDGACAVPSIFLRLLPLAYTDFRCWCCCMGDRPILMFA
jgi:hypothetical protein